MATPDVDTLLTQMNLSNAAFPGRQEGLFMPQGHAALSDQQLRNIQDQMIAAANAGDVDKVVQLEQQVIKEPLSALYEADKLKKGGNAFHSDGIIGDSTTVTNPQYAKLPGVDGTALMNNIRFAELAKLKAKQVFESNPANGDYIPKSPDYAVLDAKSIDKYYPQGASVSDYSDLMRKYGNAANAQKTAEVTAGPADAYTQQQDGSYKYNGSTPSAQDPATITADQYDQKLNDWMKTTGYYALGKNTAVPLSSIHYDEKTQVVWADNPDPKGKAILLSQGDHAANDWANLTMLATQTNRSLGGTVAPPKDVAPLSGIGGKDATGEYTYTASNTSTPKVVQTANQDANGGTTGTTPKVYIGNDADFAPLLAKAGITTATDGTITQDQFNSLYNVMDASDRAQWDQTLASVGIGSSNGSRAGGLTAWSSLGSTLSQQYTPTTTSSAVSQAEITAALEGKTPTTTTGTGTGTTPAANTAGTITDKNGLVTGATETSAAGIGAGSGTGTGSGTGAAGTNETPTDFLVSLSKNPGVGVTSAAATAQQARIKVEQDLKAYAIQNGMTLSDADLAGQVDGVINGSTTEDAILEHYRKINASRFPGIADRLLAGENLGGTNGIASGYISQMAQTLELDPNQINVTDPTVLKGLDSVTDKGAHAAMPLWAFNTMLKKDPRYQYTDAAHADYSKVAAAIAQQMEGL